MNVNDKTEEYFYTINVIEIDNNDIDIVIVPDDESLYYVKPSTEQTIIITKRTYMFALLMFDAIYLCYYILILSLLPKYDKLGTGFVVVFSSLSQIFYFLILFWFIKDYNIYLIFIKVLWYLILLVIQIIYFDIISIVITSLCIGLYVILINMDDEEEKPTTN